MELLIALLQQPVSSLFSPTPKRSKYQQYALENNFELTKRGDSWELWYDGYLERVMKSEHEACEYIYCHPKYMR
jgi:hypothetical protein